VVPIEDVTVEPAANDGEDVEHVVVPSRIERGACITQRGDDVRRGECVLEAGRRIGGPELGLLATVGCVRVPVFVRPLIGIISTGDELIDAADAIVRGKVRDSNRYAISGALRALGARPRQYPRANDSGDALRLALLAALADCDAVVLSGGSSVGVRDVVPSVVASLGAPGVVAHGLRVKPGKPTVLGALGNKPVIGLPGNPASALMVLEAVVAPVIAALTGERELLTPTLDAIAGIDIYGRAGWTWYAPVRLESATHVSGPDPRCVAYPLPLRSAHTSLLARASGYVILDESTPHIAAGKGVRVQRFRSGGAPVRAAVAEAP
jgi:molybdenum cofactor synthesis domain-containing protein